MALRPYRETEADEDLEAPDFQSILKMTSGEAPRPGPAPVGTYTVRIPEDGVALGKASTGTPQVRLNLQLLEADRDVDSEALTNYLTKPDGSSVPLSSKMVQQTYWFSDAARYRFEDFVHSIGLPKQTYDKHIESLKGITFVVHLKHRPPNQNGMVYNEIAHARPLPTQTVRRK